MHQTTETLSDAPLTSTSRSGASSSFLDSRRVRIVFAVILVAAAAALIWDEFFKYRYTAKKFGTVVPGLVFRSGQISKWMIEPTIREHNLRAIVDLNGLEPDSEDQAAEIAAAEKFNIELYRFKLSGDGTGDIRQYANAIEVIDRCERAGKPVLVHCSAGAQRTGGVVAAYRMLVKKQSPQMAYEELADYGWREGRDLELVPYVNENMGVLARLLVERGVIDEAPDPLPVLAPGE